MPDRYTYRISWSEEDGEHVATCAEFPSLSWQAETDAEALAGMKALVGDVVADLRAGGEAVPEPLAGHKYSGRFQVRMPPELHRRLKIEAAEAKVSLNRLVNLKLSAG